MRRNFTTLLFFLTCIVLYAQVNVSGVINDDFGFPVEGAKVSLSDTSVLTNEDGEFSISAQSGEILLITYDDVVIEEPINGRSFIEVSSPTSTVKLDEVVLQGYTEQKKERITGSIENFDTKIAQGAPRASVQESFQGNIAGVQVASFSGQPGALPSILIRGVGSLEAGTGPLFVVDGLQTKDPNVLLQINPDDIEGISVLKDAAALSIYGSRGGNGVVVVKTKSGNATKSVITYSTQYGVANTASAGRFKPLSTPELQELLIEGRINAGLEATEAAALDALVNNGFNPDVNTNWFDLLTQNGVFQQHNLSFSGGSKKTRFYASGSYYKQEGVILATDYERLTTRLNLDHDFSDRTRFGLNLGFVKGTENKRPDGGAFANPVRAIYRISPDFAPFNDDGTYNLDFNSTHNPIAQAREEIRKDEDYRISANANFSYDFLDNFTFETVGNFNYLFQDEFVRRPSGFGDGRNVGGNGSQDNDREFEWLIRNLIKYQKNIGKHRINAFTGIEFQQLLIKNTNLEAQTLLDRFEDLTNAVTPTEAETEKFQDGNNSVFLNGEYAYDDKYLLSASIRRDGSSKFAPTNQYGVFWSVGAAWNLTKESFLRNSKFVNDLKIRTSYGTTGNDGIPRNGFITQFATNDYNGNTGIGYATFGNPNIKWEESQSFNIGVDYAILNRRISGSFDWYQRTTTDLLFDRLLSGTNGDDDVLDNIAEMKNTGFEISLTTRNFVSRNNGFEWQTDFNFTTNKNEVTRIGDDNLPIVGSSSIIAVGEDRFTFHVPIYAGVDPLNGNALWYTDGSRTEVTANYNNAAPAVIGKATPDFYAGLRNRLSYKGFFLDFQFYMSWGGLVYDTWARFTNSDGSRTLSSTGNVSRSTYDRRWQQPGDVTDVPAFVWGNSQTGSSDNFSSRFVYDGSYIRLREMQFGYTFSKKTLKPLGLSSLQLYVKGNNLWTYIKDDRLERDPEAGITGRLDQQIPITRTYFFGLNVSF